MSKGRSEETEQRSRVGRRVLPGPFRWRPVLLGGVVGAFVGVAGATITDSKMGFPAWVDLTGVLGGFAAGALTTGLIMLVVGLRSSSSSS